MGREIKFRLWDTLYKNFVDGDEVLECVHKIEGVMEVKLEEPPTLILEQFTGLLDKNGKEVYEGDVVAHYRIESDLYEPALVEFENGCFVLRVPLFQKEDLLLPIKEAKELEVLGNVHESPELLEENNE